MATEPLDTVEELEPVDALDAPIEPEQEISGVERLLGLMQSPNIVGSEYLPDDKLAGIAEKVCHEYQIDENSRLEWFENSADAMKLAMLIAEEKDYPFKGAANVKFPLLTEAALQFNARAYSAIVQGKRVAKCGTWGRDPQGTKTARAERVSEHLSYQLLVDMPEWEEDTDRLLVILPITGCVFRKAYYDPSLGRNCSRLITADRLVVNYRARSLEDVPRITEKVYLYPHEIQERIRDRRFAEFEYGDASSDDDKETTGDDAEAPHLFLEQHRLLDLDEDGYPEPYIVTVHKETQKVCRIVANFTPETMRFTDDGKVVSIRRQTYYVKYQFLPSPDGGFYGLGFGSLLKSIGESINTTLNLMIDAGHMANVQGGLVSSVLGVKDKSIRLQMGEWRVLNTNMPLNQAVMPITYPGPSDTLFKLLGMLIEAGKGITVVKDVLTGEGQGKNASPTTTLALIEQGLQVFTSIYKRVYRALKAELGIMARLNRDNLPIEEYNAFFDDQEQHDPAADYAEGDMDILPVSDPNTVSRMQELAKAQFVLETSRGNPIINQHEALRRVYEAAHIEDIDKLIMPPPQPDPEEEILKRMLAELTMEKQEGEILETYTKALKNIADAEAAEEGTQLQAYQAYVSSLQQMLEARMNGQGRVSGMEGQPGNPMGAAPTGPAGPTGGQPMPGGSVPVGGAEPAGMGGAPSPGGVPQGSF